MVTAVKYSCLWCKRPADGVYFIHGGCVISNVELRNLCEQCIKILKPKGKITKVKCLKASCKKCEAQVRTDIGYTWHAEEVHVNSLMHHLNKLDNKGYEVIDVHYFPREAEKIRCAMVVGRKKKWTNH